MGKWVYVRSKKVPGKPGLWPDKKKQEVLTTYLTTGSVRQTSAICNVPEDTIYLWKRQPWWTEMQEQFQDEEHVELSAKLSKVLAKSIDAVNDRIENGDIQFNPKTGKVMRVDAKLKDLHRVSVDLIEKKLSLQKNKRVQREDKETTEGRLLKLAETFAQLVNKKDLEVKDVKEVYEGDYTNIPEEVANAINTDKGVCEVPETSTGETN